MVFIGTVCNCEIFRVERKKGMISAESVKTACNLIMTFSNKQLESKIFDRMDILEKNIKLGNIINK